MGVRMCRCLQGVVPQWLACLSYEQYMGGNTCTCLVNSHMTGLSRGFKLQLEVNCMIQKRQQGIRRMYALQSCTTLWGIKSLVEHPSLLALGSTHPGCCRYTELLPLA